jgi:large subunit ribosomal protein L20
MPRVKGGYTTRRRRKAVLKLAKGYYGSKHTLYKTAHEQVMRSMQYAFRDRKARKREFRRLWIQRINAACQLNGIKYSRFINGLANANITINRKMLAEMAVNDQAGFKALVDLAKKGLENAPAKEVENVVVLTKTAKASK